MAQLLSKKYFGFYIRTLFFLTTVAFILYIFPREGKFRYEFQKGKPWKHELLVAPFNFPIYKSQNELAAERDSTLKNYKPYYKVVPEALTEVSEKLENRFNTEWDQLQEQDLHPDDTLKASYINAILSLTKGIYDDGIISFSEQNRLTISGTSSIVVVNQEIARPVLLSEAVTPKVAYEKMVAGARELHSLTYIDALIQNMELNNYLKANLEFDKELSEKLKTEMLQNISLTSGLIQTGEKIIDKGEVIFDQKFKILESFKRAYGERIGVSSKRNVVLGGQGLLILVLLATFFLYLFYYRRDIFDNLKDFSFILLNILLFIGLSAVAERISFIPIYILPYAMLPIVLRTFFDSRTALFANTITILLASFFADNSFEFILLQLTTGIAATFTLRDLNRRAQLFQASIIVFLVYSLMFLGLGLIQEGDVTLIYYEGFIFFAINGILMLFAYPLIYVYEKAFRYVSNVTLMELANTNHPLLRKLSENAPGTFHHCIQVSNLCQEAAIRIGANPLLAYVGSLYHDIGKSVNSVYFTENQAGQQSPHKNLQPEESAHIIIDHVKEGVKLAQKHGLPNQIINFIKTHHGFGQTKFFLYQYKQSHPEEALPNDKFSYPGPDPFTKETAILMMADSVEASSRSLESYTDETIDAQVEKIIESQLQEGRFKFAPITFAEIEIIKATFKEKLKNIYHTRIAYPEEKKEDEKHV